MSSTTHSIELTSEERKKKAEEIVSKWITMQKTIKEEITLDEILLQHMQTQHASLLESYRNFYWSTIKAREYSIIKRDNNWFHFFSSSHIYSIEKIDS